MSHNLETVTDGYLSALVVRGQATQHSPSSNYARITKLGGGFRGTQGIRIKTRKVETDEGAGPVDIRGEDLYALREFLAELPEEAFVRPAEPVEKPERWTDGDIVEEWISGKMKRIWIRQDDDLWHAPGIASTLRDEIVESGLRYDRNESRHWSAVIVRQTSGQDL